MMVLDVGTGSGIAAVAASERGARMVVGVDRSEGMLRQARRHGVICAAAALPGLPFADETFDRVLASFVLSHVASYRLALADIVRVVRRGGKVAATAWGAMPCAPRDFWDSLAHRRADRERLRAALEEALPWEDWLMDAAHLREAFEEAGLAAVEVHRKIYEVRLTIADFLAMRENSMQARFMRQTLDAAEWEAFKGDLTREFHAKFSDPVDHPRDVLIATGVRP
jgi:ubiquinone/menaquinone biosynthesis C-methylase UbiE